MDELIEQQLKKTHELLEKRFEEVIRLTDEIHKITKDIKRDYLDIGQMHVNTIRFNDVMAELNEEYDLIMTICDTYEIRLLGECLSKPKRKRGWEEEE